MKAGTFLSIKLNKELNKVVIIIVLNFIFFTNSSYSQINVNSSGKVGINQSYPSYNLDWSGDGRYQSGYGAIVFDRSGWGNVATIHPEQDWFACLGTSSKEFNVLYVDHVI